MNRLQKPGKDVGPIEYLVDMRHRAAEHRAQELERDLRHRTGSARMRAPAEFGVSGSSARFRLG